MEVVVEVTAQNFSTGKKRRVAKAYVRYVSLNENGYPHAAPGLLCKDEKEKVEQKKAEER